MDWYYINITAI